MQSDTLHFAQAFLTVSLVERAFKPATSAFVPTFRRRLSAALDPGEQVGVKNVALRQRSQKLQPQASVCATVTRIE